MFFFFFNFVAKTEVPLQVSLILSRNSIQDHKEIMEFYRGSPKDSGVQFRMPKRFMNSVQDPSEIEYCSKFVDRFWTSVQDPRQIWEFFKQS